jgi:hypothetical protein
VLPWLPLALMVASLAAIAQSAVAAHAGDNFVVPGTLVDEATAEPVAMGQISFGHVGSSVMSDAQGNFSFRSAARSGDRGPDSKIARWPIGR